MTIIRRNANADICTRYRPRRLSEVIGNETQVRAIKKAFEQGEARPKVMCFIGDRGCSKTSIARILAAGLNCEHGDTTEPCLECESCKAVLEDKAMFVNEINCAKYSNKGDMFSLSDDMKNACFSGRNQIYILDEAHMLNRQAMNLLLKDFEEVPPNVYVFLCTSQPERIDKALFDRFDTYHLKNPTRAQAERVASDICSQEGWHHLDGQQEMNEFLDAVEGFSFRQVVKAVDRCYRGGIELIGQVKFDAQPETFELVRSMFSSGDFDGIAKKIKGMQSFEYESFRMIARAYAETMLVSTGFRNPDKSYAITQVIDIFDRPYYDADSPRFFRDLFNACVISRSSIK